MATAIWVPSHVKRLKMAARTCSSATYRSKSRTMHMTPYYELRDLERRMRAAPFES